MCSKYRYIHFARYVYTFSSPTATPAKTPGTVPSMDAPATTPISATFFITFLCFTYQYFLEMWSKNEHSKAVLDSVNTFSIA